VLDVRIAIDGEPLNPAGQENFEPPEVLTGMSWGMATLENPAGAGTSWTTMVTLAQHQMTAGNHQVDLMFRSRTSGPVYLNGPTLWLLRFGAF
jgi:hypothetical protein